MDKKQVKETRKADLDLLEEILHDEKTTPAVKIQAIQTREDPDNTRRSAGADGGTTDRQDPGGIGGLIAWHNYRASSISEDGWA